MSHFFAVTAFRTDSSQEVLSAVADYLSMHRVAHEPVLSGPPDHGRDALIYAPVNGWTVVFWPETFNLYDVPLAASIAASRGWLVSTVHVYDGEYWEHFAFQGAVQIHAFASRPHFWEDESEQDFTRMMGYDSSPLRLAQAVGVVPEAVQPYLVDADQVSEDQKAFPDDPYGLGDFWVFTSFWMRLGIAYPTPYVGLVASLRLWRFFSKRLPTG